MRKILFALPALMILVAACSGNKNDGSENDGKIVVDTFYSPDLNFGELRGPVKDCKRITLDGELKDGKIVEAKNAAGTTQTLKYDEKGKITCVTEAIIENGAEDFPYSSTFSYDSNGNLEEAVTTDDGSLKIVRNPEGFIEAFSKINTSGEADFLKKYQWENGVLVLENSINDVSAYETADKRAPNVSDETKYSYDDKKYRVSQTRRFGDSEIETTVVETKFDNKEFDKHGNWTLRVVTQVSKRYGEYSDENSVPVETDTTYLIEKRTITYHK